MQHLQTKGTELDFSCGEYSTFGSEYCGNGNTKGNKHESRSASMHANAPPFSCCRFLKQILQACLRPFPRHWGHFFKGGYNQSLWNKLCINVITLLGFKYSAQCRDGWLTYLITGTIALPWVKLKVLSLLQYLYLTLFFFTVNKLYRQLKHQSVIQVTFCYTLILPIESPSYLLASV